MPATTSEWLLLVAVMILARIAVTIATFKAGERHARYKMRARLADWLFKGRLHPVTKVRKGKLVVPMSLRVTQRRRAPKRRKVLSVVRRDDSSAGPA